MQLAIVSALHWLWLGPVQCSSTVPVRFYLLKNPSLADTKKAPTREGRAWPFVTIRSAIIGVSSLVTVRVGGVLTHLFGLF